MSEPAALASQGSSDTRHNLDLERIYVSQRAFVWLTLQRMGIPSADLEDVFQDVFMIVHKRLHSYRPEAKLTAWLYGICLRSVARHRRRAFRRREKPTNLDSDSEQPGLDGWNAEAESPDQVLQQRDRQARLNHVLDTLDPEHRVVVVMYEIEELSCADISATLDVPVGTVHSRLYNARRKLAEAIKRLHPSGGAP